MKRLIDSEMELWRASGSEEASSEGDLRLKIKLLRESFVDFVNPNFVTDERNSSADVCRDDRSLFSMDEKSTKCVILAVGFWFSRPSPIGWEKRIKRHVR